MNPKEFYESYGGEPTPATDANSDRILQRGSSYELTEENLPGQGRWLDLGCGNGKYLPAMSNKYDEVWGVDIVKDCGKKCIDMIATNTEEDGKFHFIVTDINERLDFTSGYFDCVTILAVLEHLFDPFAIIHECYRLLRPGGTLIVYVPNVAYVTNRLRLAGGKLPVTSEAGGAWDAGHLHYFTRSSLKQLFEKEGFSVMKITSGGPFRKIRNIWGSLLSSDIMIVGKR
jgi:ubiquinone/menaquinone biosynthesis C-methylase UbiE